jgi:hypothetical protein
MMKMSRLTRLFMLLAVPLVLNPRVKAADGVAAKPAANVSQEVQFNRDIRPILSGKCFACHGPDKNKRKADLRLDTQAGLLGAGKKAGVIVSGKPSESELWRRITATSPDEHMPPAEFGKDLSDADRKLFRRWIEQGAQWEGHWAFLPIGRPKPPTVKPTPFHNNDIDDFILQGLHEHNLAPSPPADRVTLLRRLRIDLTGLPPTTEEIDAFQADHSDGAYEKTVDRLLASPHFGERMAMWWLDLVRYADSVGYHGDQPVSVSPFRDYVIQSFNDNKPFDRFTLEQLAGDLLPEKTTEQKIASGYNRLGMMSAEGGVQPNEYLAKYIAERVRNVGGTWLGVTLGCCECHDHKFDPFLTRDFYSMEAFFADIEERGLYSGANADGNWGPRIKLPSSAQAAQREKLDRELAKTRKLAESPGAGQESAKKTLKELERRVADLDARIPQTLITVAVTPRPIRVLPRGNWMDTSGAVVSPAFPEVLPHPARGDSRLTRANLARWITSPENPLTARVLANRLWKMYFGAGLSRKLDDQGAQGDWPSHPQLLDWLAGQLIDSHWNMKHVVKLIVMSGTYRQTSQCNATLRERDPENRWLARQGRFRLDAELVRDNALAISGLLVEHVGGPSVKPYQPPGYWSYLNFPAREWENGAGDELYRRSLYTHWQRQYLHPAMLAFDAPSREECTADRSRSNTPLQSLVLMNDAEFVEAARAFAEQTLLHGGTTAVDRLNWAFRRALSRLPAPSEIAVLKKLAATHQAEYQRDPKAAAALVKVGAHAVPKNVDPVELAAWSSVTRTILNLHETITRN